MTKFKNAYYTYEIENCFTKYLIAPSNFIKYEISRVRQEINTARNIVCNLRKHFNSNLTYPKKRFLIDKDGDYLLTKLFHSITEIFKDIL